ncbi:MAG: ABC transporter permease [Acidimicrobiales bacterium]
MRRVVTPAVFGVALILAWEGAVNVFDIQQFLLPKPSAIWSALLEHRTAIRKGLTVTGGNAVYGLVVGSTLGVVGALLTARFRLVNETLQPLAAAINATPIVALATIFNNWFNGSTDEFSRRLVVILVVFFPVFVNVAKGLTQVDATHLTLMRSYAASEWAITRRVRIPNALPFFMGALTLVAPLALIAAIVAEYFGGTQGSLGQIITQAAGLTRYDRAWAAVLVASVMGLVLFAGALLLERAVLPYRRETMR